MSRIKVDKELEEFRSLMEVPSTFEEGFSWTALVAALFIAMVMVPGAIYMQLLAGQGVGPAAQWVTVILFIEVARRAHRHLKKAELFVLFYMAGAIMAVPFSGLLWNQFFVQSQAAIGLGVAENVPHWVAPNDPDVLALRTFFHPAWYPAVGLMVFTMLMGRINSSILSYGLFRLASDVEKLPFPMAPVGAQGITALAEQQSEETSRSRGTQQADDTSWRWRIFSIGGVLGLSFGAIYLALPAISSAILGDPITIIPIPFVDWTPKTSEYIPALETGLNLNLNQVVFGMVMPFFAMLGSLLGFLMKAVANPLLYKYDFLPTWTTRDDTVATIFHNTIDFYFSFSIGLGFAVAAVGIWQVLRGIQQSRKERRRRAEAGEADERDDTGVPTGRGDLPTSVIIGTYLFTSASYILISGYLIDWHRSVMIVLFFFAYLYTPLISYVTARLEGLTGQVVQIPFVREAAFILSGYQGGVEVWFLPVPYADYGRRTVFYRQAELTGTRFWSVWKAELILVPIIVLSTVLFAQFIWSLDEIPSAAYPYTEVMWELNAANRCIIFSSTLGRFSQFEEAFRWEYLASGTAFGVVLFAILRPLGTPIMLIYGIFRGINNTIPHVIIPQFIGALIGRYYFRRRMGLKWRQYAPVVAAGFTCGMGLVTVLGIGFNFLAKSVIKIPF